MLALIGSRALKFRAPMILRRDPLDFDFIATEEAYEDFVKKNNDKIRPEEIYPMEGGQKMIVKGEKKEGDEIGVILEFEIAEKRESGAQFLKMVESDPLTLKTPFGSVPSLDLLFTLKKSHRYLKNSPHFGKNFNDYHAMKRIGASSEKFTEWLKLREKETYATQKHPKLNVKKEEFFANDQVNYVHDHDSIHVSVCHPDIGKPAYQVYAEPGQEVKSSKKLFFEASDFVRMRGVVEESAVLAIERSLVPHPGKLEPRHAWMFAFSKVATSITSGWFREWAYENGPVVLRNYPEDFYDRFLEGVKNGIVKPFNANVAVNPYK